MLFARKRGFAYPYFLYENESLQHFLSHDLGKMATLFVLKVRFFQRPFIMVSVFSQVQGPDQGPDQDLF